MPGDPLAQTKPCAHCGRPFSNRLRWSGRDQWEAVRYCSERCRREAARTRRAGDGPDR